MPQLRNDVAAAMFGESGRELQHGRQRRQVPNRTGVSAIFRKEPTLDGSVFLVRDLTLSVRISQPLQELIFGVGRTITIVIPVTNLQNQETSQEARNNRANPPSQIGIHELLQLLQLFWPHDRSLALSERHYLPREAPWQELAARYCRKAWTAQPEPVPACV